MTTAHSFMDQHLQRIRIVLVETRTPGNIGGVARAMKSMGLQHLYLVRPERPQAREAYLRAVWSEDILEQAHCVDTLDEAIHDCTYIVAVSAKKNRFPSLNMTSPHLASHLQALKLEEKIALVFGRESTGLRAHELDRCNLHVRIPSSDLQPSLNLASAVQVITYELYSKALAYQESLDYSTQEVNHEHTQPSYSPKADEHALESYFKHLEQVLIELQVLNPQKPGQLMPRLRRLYKRQQIEYVEINILRGILSKTQHLLHQLKNKKSTDQH